MKYVVTASSAGGRYAEHVRPLLGTDDGPFHGGFRGTPLADGTRPALCGVLLAGGWDTTLPLPGAGRAPVTACQECRAAYLAILNPPAPPKPPRERRYRGETTHVDTAYGIDGLAAWTDGSGTLQDTPAAIGVIVALDGEVVVEASEYIGLGTNNVAEVRAIGRALALSFAVAGRRGPLTIFSDSEFAMGAVCRGSTWEIHESGNPDLRALVLKIRIEVARWTELTFAHVKGHSGNLGNERCDWLAGRARKARIASVTRSNEES